MVLVLDQVTCGQKKSVKIKLKENLVIELVQKSAAYPSV
jgi:hypothetical protein